MLSALEPARYEDSRDDQSPVSKYRRRIEEKGMNERRLDRAGQCPSLSEAILHEEFGILLQADA